MARPPGGLAGASFGSSGAFFSSSTGSTTGGAFSTRLSAPPEIESRNEGAALIDGYGGGLSSYSIA